jgi:hypothetical protein
VKNDSPKVIIVSKPSLQVLIDGMPQMREVPGTKLLGNSDFIVGDRTGMNRLSFLS